MQEHHLVADPPSNLPLLISPMAFQLECMNDIVYQGVYTRMDPRIHR